MQRLFPAGADVAKGELAPAMFYANSYHASGDGVASGGRGGPWRGGLRGGAQWGGCRGGPPSRGGPNPWRGGRWQPRGRYSPYGPPRGGGPRHQQS
eukprot:2179119-Rhodomonas_salina.1